jgi:hypothetical protein
MFLERAQNVFHFCNEELLNYCTSHSENISDQWVAHGGLRKMVLFHCILTEISMQVQTLNSIQRGHLMAMFIGRAP